MNQEANLILYEYTGEAVWEPITQGVTTSPSDDYVRALYSANPQLIYKTLIFQRGQ